MPAEHTTSKPSKNAESSERVTHSTRVSNKNVQSGTEQKVLPSKKQHKELVTSQDRLFGPPDEYKPCIKSRGLRNQQTEESPPIPSRRIPKDPAKPEQPKPTSRKTFTDKSTTVFKGGAAVITTEAKCSDDAPAAVCGRGLPSANADGPFEKPAKPNFANTGSLNRTLSEREPSASKPIIRCNAASNAARPAPFAIE